MGIVHRLIATAGIAAGLTAAATGIAAAESEPEPPKCPLTQFIETWPPAPAGCNDWWEPIEESVEDSVPPQVEGVFDAFDDWCEGDAD
ncbi:hypothetical protein ACWEVD_14145 [Nocardia thailandica]